MRLLVLFLSSFVLFGCGSTASNADLSVSLFQPSVLVLNKPRGASQWTGQVQVSSKVQYNGGPYGYNYSNGYLSRRWNLNLPYPLSGRVYDYGSYIILYVTSDIVPEPSATGSVSLDVWEVNGGAEASDRITVDILLGANA